MYKRIASRTHFASLALSLVIVVSNVHANEAPTAPDNLMGVAVSTSEIRLSWDPSTDDRRVKNYSIHRDDRHIATIKNTFYTDSSLSAETAYRYTVVASDGTLESAAAEFLISTPATDPTADIGEETTNKPGRGKGGKNNSPTEEPPVEEPPEEVPPPEEPDPDAPPVEDPPTGDPGTAGPPTGWLLRFADEFDGDGDLDTTSSLRNWRFESMQDGLHRAGNNGLNAMGEVVESWDSVRGKRWSAWYDGYHTSNAFRENGELILGGYDSGEMDATRPVDYTDNGVSTTYGRSKLYTAWIDTFSRKWTGPGDLHVMDPESPGKLFKYGYFETRVNFSEMMTPGFRLSLWLMPGSNDADGQDLVVSHAYDADGNNGVEIDIFEYEWINTDFENRINLAVIGGAAGSSGTNLDTSTLGINLHEGYHTIGFLWQADRMIWYIDGIAVKEITDVNLIPDVYSYLIYSREMNSGVKNLDVDGFEPGDKVEELPYIPRDPGLYATNVWEFRDRINSDRAIVDYIRVWQP